ILCSGIPVALFLIGAGLTASVAATVFACFAFLVLGPVLVFTSILGFWVWGSLWVLVIGGRWAYERVDGRSVNHGVMEVKKENEGEVAGIGDGEGKSKGKDGGFVVEEKEVSE
ncbi:hypothetical protein PHISCL_09025, partial [Aspergillus sclerotialis]